MAQPDYQGDDGTYYPAPGRKPAPPGPGYVWDEYLQQWVPEQAPQTPPSVEPDPNPTTPPTTTPPRNFLYEPYAGGNRPEFNFPGAPEFPFQAPGAFVAPSAADAENEPGYQFRMGQGRKALEQSAAGRGVLRTGGTLKDILGYGQNFASQEYGRVYDRKAGEYDRTYGNQFELAKAQFQPKLLDWQGRFDAERKAGEAQFGRGWEEYLYDQEDRYRRWRDILDAGAA
jgi:hypothetical protein